jgi:hypothetical protein
MGILKLRQYRFWTAAALPQNSAAVVRLRTSTLPLPQKRGNAVSCTTAPLPQAKKRPPSKPSHGKNSSLDRLHRKWPAIVAVGGNPQIGNPLKYSSQVIDKTIYYR